jgi:hypothetical protein
MSHSTPNTFRMQGSLLVPTSFSYDAIQDKGRRRKPAVRTMAEGAHLSGRKKDKATGTVRDQQRNFSLVGWMCRQHVNSVARFMPMVRTKSREVNKYVKRLLRHHGRPGNFDIAGRHSRERFIQLFEMSRIISGSGGILKRKGWQCQAIEGEKITKPGSWPKGNPGKGNKALRDKCGDDGRVVNADGKVTHYCVCKRTNKGKTLAFDRFVRADLIAADGTFERFDDFAGKSPLLSATEMLADTKENMEYVNLQIKKAAYYGLAFYSENPEDMPDDEDEDDAAARTYDPKFNMTEKPIVLNLDDGDKVQELGTKTPNGNIENYLNELIIRCCLLALDIPFSFYDGTGISYSGRIADANRYEEACEAKRRDNIEILIQLYNDWILPEWWAADYMNIRSMCEKFDVDLTELTFGVDWVPAGKIWIDQLNQGKAIALHLAMGLTSIPAECASYGKDAYDIADEQGDYLDYCDNDAHIPILYGAPGQEAIQNILAEPAPDDETPPAKSTKRAQPENAQ